VYGQFERRTEASAQARLLRPDNGAGLMELLPHRPSSRENVREDVKLSALDVCRLWHSRLQLDHIAVDSKPAVSVMVDGLRILLRRIDPGLEHFKDEEIVSFDETGVGRLSTEADLSSRSRSWNPSATVVRRGPL
jgi:hypothetical protein